MSESKFPWRTLLFVSGALNLLVVGAVAGALAAGVRIERGGPGSAPPQMPGAPRVIVAALPPELRQRIGDEVAQSYQASADQRRAAADARRAAYEAATAEPYDVVRVRAAFARMREADQAAVAVFHDSFAQSLATLSPQERRAAMDAIRLNAVQRFQERRERREERMERWRERRERMRGN